MEIVYDNVVREKYPDPIPNHDEEITQLLKYDHELQSGQIPRPKTKDAYFAVLRDTENRIRELVADNKNIEALNILERKKVDDKYAADVEAAKVDETYIGKALSFCIDEQLNSTLWYTAPDSGLSIAQAGIATKWRKDIMAITETTSTITESVTKFNTLVASKPDYNIKWKKKP